MCSSPKYLFIMFLFHSLAAGSNSATFTIVNRCSLTVFPGISHGFEFGDSLPPSTGFSLQTGESIVLTMPSSWSGSLWGRTHCSHDSNGKFSCLTGDCASSTIECNGGNAFSPATLAEFRLNVKSSGFDFFRINLVNGYNLPLTVEPQVGNGAGDCMTAGCMVNLGTVCPSELKVMSGGDCIGCRSACKPFSKHCYSEFFFTKACPHAKVDATAKTFQGVCASTNYLITLCHASTSLDKPRKEKNPVDNSDGRKKKRSTNNNIPRSKKHNNSHAWFKNHILLVIGIVSAFLVGTPISIKVYCCICFNRNSVPNNL